MKNVLKGCLVVFVAGFVLFAALVVFFIIHPPKNSSSSHSASAEYSSALASAEEKANADTSYTFDESDNKLDDQGFGYAYFGNDDQFFKSISDEPKSVSATSNSAQNKTCEAKVRQYWDWIPNGVKFNCADTQSEMVSSLGNRPPADAGSKGPGEKNFPVDVSGLTSYNGPESPAYWNTVGHPNVNVAVSLFSPDVSTSDAEFDRTFFHELGHIYSELYVGAESNSGSFTAFRHIIGVAKDTDYKTNAMEQFARGFATCFHNQPIEDGYVNPSCDAMQKIRQQVISDVGIDIAKKPVQISSTFTPR